MYCADELILVVFYKTLLQQPTRVGNLRDLFWSILKPCPLQRISPGVSGTTTSTSVHAKVVIFRKGVDEHELLAYTAMVPHSAGVSLSPIGMLSASMTCRSCGIICRKLLSGRRSSDTTRNSISITPETQNSEDHRRVHTEGGRGATEQMPTKEGGAGVF